MGFRKPTNVTTSTLVHIKVKYCSLLSRPTSEVNRLAIVHFIWCLFMSYMYGNSSIESSTSFFSNIYSIFQLKSFSILAYNDKRNFPVKLMAFYISGQIRWPCSYGRHMKIYIQNDRNTHAWSGHGGHILELVEKYQSNNVLLLYTFCKYPSSQ